MYLGLRKCKNDCKILTIILVPDFVHYNLKLLDFLSDFVLIFFIRNYPCSFMVYYYLFGGKGYFRDSWIA